MDFISCHFHEETQPHKSIPLQPSGTKVALLNTTVQTLYQIPDSELTGKKITNKINLIMLVEAKSVIFNDAQLMW